jgi:hypothetical protein
MGHIRLDEDVVFKDLNKNIVVIGFGLDLKWCAKYQSMTILISINSVRWQIWFMFYIMEVDMEFNCF